MRITLGSDHAGFELKGALREYLEQQGHTTTDVGTKGTAPVDYPDFAEAVALSVLQGQSERGILICGSGVGASVAANKIPGVRAGLAHDSYSAHQGVEHDDMNILVLGSRVIGVELAKDLCDIFLSAHFTGEERHQRRLAKVHNLEQRYALQPSAQEGKR
jgi:ribose 5-phosphate isomerase B